MAAVEWKPLRPAWRGLAARACSNRCRAPDRQLLRGALRQEAGDHSAPGRILGLRAFGAFLAGEVVTGHFAPPLYPATAGISTSSHH